MSASSKRLFVGVASTLALAFLYAVLTATAAHALSITVSNGSDSGAGSLRAALASASNGDTVNFDPSVTDVVLTTAQLNVTNGVSIVGPGADKLAIRRSSAGGTPEFGIFSVVLGTNTTAAISGVTITNGSATPGGGINFASSGTAKLNLTGVVVTGNNAGGWGGGINTFGSQSSLLTIDSSTVSNNTTNGGDPSPNSGSNGAGIKTEAPVTIINSTVSGNIAGDKAAGIKVDTAVKIVNSTFANNIAYGSKGGAIWETSGVSNPDLQMTNTLIANNTVGGGGHECDVDAPNTTLSVNTNNLIEDSSCNFLWASGGISGSATNFLSGDPNLGVLTNNGGPTPTQALDIASIARGSGDEATCQASPLNGLDQRGITRPNPCSIGAFDGAATYNLAVSKSGSGTGTVTSSPAGIDCGSTCSTSFIPGAFITLTAAAATGSSFTGWSGACSGSAATCDVTMNQVNNVTAEFTTAKAPTTTEAPASPTVASTTAATSAPSTSAPLATPGTIALSAQAPGLRGDGCVIKTPMRQSFTVPFEVSTDAEMSYVLRYRKRSNKLSHSCKLGSGSNSKGSLKTVLKWNSKATAGKNKVRIFLSGLKPGRYSLEMFATEANGATSKRTGPKFVVVSKQK